MKQIVVISGHAEAGKDYMAIEIEDALESYDATILILHYADYLKYLCKMYFDWDGNKDDVGREILQRIGTDVIRNKTPEFWVRNVCQLIEVFWNEYDYILIPDCRFPNEIEGMVNTFGEKFVSSIRVKRINEHGFSFENSLTNEQNSHKSETALNTRVDLFDLIVENNGFENGSNISSIKRIIEHLTSKEKL